MSNKDCWKLVDSVIGNSNRILLYGAPGTGKTYSAVKQNTPLNLDGEPNVYQVTMTEDTASANLEGFYMPNSSGAFEWHDGIAIQSWRNGGRLVINEIDHASPDAMTLPESLPLALKDRFPVKIHVNSIHPKAMEKFPESWHKVIADTSLTENMEERISVRSWREFFELVNVKNIDKMISAQLVFGDRGEELLDAIKLTDLDVNDYVGEEE